MKETALYITETCQIEAGKLYKNQHLLYQAENENELLPSFLKSIYQKQKITYPKFYRMDDLSKLAFIGAEILLENIAFDKPNHDIALILSNKNSSLNTDKNHLKTIQKETEFYPSPAIFVYTLPNICLAEINIYHQLQSENAFFISEKFDADNIFHQTQYLMKTGKAEKVLAGWVDCLDENYKLAFYLVEKHGDTLHTIENINELMK